MSRSIRSTVLFGAACLSLACSSDPDSEQTKPTPILDATISGIVIDENLEVVAAMKICVDGRPEIPCTTTDSLGQYDLGVPNHERVTLRYEKDGFVPKLRMEDSGEAGFFSMWSMQHRAWYEQQAKVLGVTLNLDLAMLSLQAAGEEGVIFSLDPALGKGPYYGDEHGNADPSLGATSSSGVGAFLDLPEGDYTATFTLDGASCVPKVGDGASPSVKIPVRAGYVTHVGAKCN